MGLSLVCSYGGGALSTALIRGWGCLLLAAMGVGLSLVCSYGCGAVSTALIRGWGCLKNPTWSDGVRINVFVCSIYL
jgi:hypothetical protein